MLIKTTMRYCHIPLRMAKNKKIKMAIPKADMDAEHLELSNMDGENARWTSHFTKQFHSFLCIYIYLPYNPSFPFLGIYQNEMKHNINTWIIIMVLFRIAQNCKQSECSSTGEKINWHIHTIKRNGLSMPATTQLNLKFIMLNERCQIQSYTYYNSTLWHSRKDKTIRKENRSVARGKKRNWI